MVIIPAMDLLEGKVVRLFKGDPKQATVYSHDPLAIADDFVKAKAKLLHIVDLSAAFGKDNNRKIIREIIKTTGLEVEVGGGIRDIAIAKELIDYGAQRVIIGTKGMDSKFLDNLIAALGKQRIAVSVDVVDSFFAIEGWQKKTNITAKEAVEFLHKKGIRWVVYTDVSRDGTLVGANTQTMQAWHNFKDINFISSGGVSCLEDLKKIKASLPFVWGVIVGKAIYEKKLDLKAAIDWEKNS